jgi:hypothetical protein
MLETGITTAFKSVAGILEAVNCKLWRLAIALQLPVVQNAVYKVSINPII